ncbi:hypothetical protein [Acidaminococcus sp.]|uniref:hypothetical protein n=1 Tax=Acidaminococcus sp. TaxID=1872103 RepID=UPI003D7EF628
MVWVKKNADKEKISDKAAQLMLDNGYSEVIIFAKKDEAHSDDGADANYLWWCEGTSYSMMQLAKVALVQGLKWMDLRLQMIAIGKLSTEVLKLLNRGITDEQIQKAGDEIDGMDLGSDDKLDQMN